MLIPRKPVDEEGNEIDPRDELVQRLLEYKRYKSVLEEMRQKEEQRSKQIARGNAGKDLKVIANKALVDLELESLSLFKVMATFEKVTIQGQQVYILSKIKLTDKTAFVNIFSQCENRMHAIVTFLAMLELLNLSKLYLIQGEGINNFWLTQENEEDEEVVVSENESTDSITPEELIDDSDD